METKVPIGEVIRRLRRKNGVTQDRLAAHLNVTPQAVSRWESGICYPDIDSLPAIADFFAVGMDELLGYTAGHKEQKAKEYIRKTEQFLDEDRLPEALETVRAGMAEIPASYELRLECASVLSAVAQTVREKAGNRPGAQEQIRACLDEGVSLCRSVLDTCHNDSVRDRAKKQLCTMYAHQLNKPDEALAIADSFHDMSCCREIIKATVLTGDTAFNQILQNLIAFTDNMWWHIYNLAVAPDVSDGQFSVEERIGLLQKSIDLLDWLFEGNPLYYADRYMNAYRQMAMLCLSPECTAPGAKASAVSCLKKAASFAKTFDSRPDTSAYSGSLISRSVYEKDEDREGAGRGRSRCARLAKDLENRAVWSCLRSGEYAADFFALITDLNPKEERGRRQKSKATSEARS